MKKKASKDPDDLQDIMKKEIMNKINQSADQEKDTFMKTLKGVMSYEKPRAKAETKDMEKKDN